MKVYVNKLPKNCAECDFCGRLKPPAERPEIECMHCNMAKKFNSISPFCPLETLADHDKKVRAEVVEENQALKERWEKLKEYITQKIETDYDWCAYVYPEGLKKMQEILETMKELEE